MLFFFTTDDSEYQSSPTVGAGLPCPKISGAPPNGNARGPIDRLQRRVESANCFRCRAAQLSVQKYPLRISSKNSWMMLNEGKVLKKSSPFRFKNSTEISWNPAIHAAPRHLQQWIVPRTDWMVPSRQPRTMSQDACHRALGKRMEKGSRNSGDTWSPACRNYQIERLQKFETTWKSPTIKVVMISCD